MTLDEFKATMRVLSPMEYDQEFEWFLAEITGPDEIVLCYGNGNWIIQRLIEATYWTCIYTDVLDTRDGTLSLHDIELRLYDISTEAKYRGRLRAPVFLCPLILRFLMRALFSLKIARGLFGDGPISFLDERRGNDATHKGENK